MGKQPVMKSRYHSSFVHALTPSPMTDDTLAPPLSKTRRKQAMEDLQALGEALVELSSERVKRLDIPDDLREAIIEAQRMTRHDEARRRQMQFIGRLMRDVDAAGIAQRLAGLEGDSPQAKARRAQLERLRERFLEDERVLGEILAWAPQADVQHLRALRRKVLEERQKGEPTGESYRALYRELKVLFEAREAEGRLDSAAEEGGEE